jgi:hypothetical protein
MLFDIYTEPLL